MRVRIPPPLLAVAAAALMWWLDRRMPVVRLLMPPWNRIGWVFICVGFGIDLTSIAEFLRAKTTVNPIRIERAARLVVTGLYRVSRNPMYLGLLTVLFGWAVILGSLAPFLVMVTVERLLVVMQIKAEEAALAAKFGDEYVDYTRRVRRWIGWVRQR